MISQPTLEANLFMLHAIRPTDATAIQQPASGRAIPDTMISIPHPYPDGEAERYVAWYQEDQATGEAVTFVIQEKTTNRFCGPVEIQATEREHLQAGMSVWVAAKCRGGGCMSEAIQAMLSYSFDDLGLNLFYAYDLVQNPVSGRVLKKSGFRQEGYLRQRVIKGANSGCGVVGDPMGGLG